MAYLLTDDNSTKGRDPIINIINGLHKIKGRKSVNILVFNYTNKHVELSFSITELIFQARDKLLPGTKPGFLKSEENVELEI